MKNNQKLNEAFADIDGTFVEKASTPPKKSAMPLYIAIACAIVVFAIGSAIVLPALFKQDPTKTLPPAISNGSPTQSEKPTPSDKPTPTPSKEPSLTPTPSKEPVDPPKPTVPTWYTPGSLTVLSLTRLSEQTKPAAPISVPAASAAIGSATVNQTLTLTDSSASLSPINGRYVNLTDLSAGSEHNGHGCLLYDVQSGKMICYGCMAKELITAPLEEGERIVVDPETTPNLLSFAIYRDKENEITARYIYDPQKELLRQIPLLSKQDFGYYTVSPDSRYLLTASDRRDGSHYFDIHLIDVETLTPKVVSGEYLTTSDVEFSPDGKTLFIVLADEDGSTHIDTDKIRYLMVNMDTGASTVCEGKILSFANGLVVTRYRADYRVYDRAKTCEIEIPKNTFVFEVRLNNIVRINVQSGAEDVLTSLPDVWNLSNDSLYAYAYTTGNNYLTVFSLKTGQSFKVDVSSDFALSVKEFQKTKSIHYSISLNEDGSELLICYSLSTKSTRPTNNTTQATKDAFLESSSIKEFLVRFEELCTVKHLYSVYKGEGFIHLKMSHCVIVEDYRAGTFTAYDDPNYDHLRISNSKSLIGQERIVALSSTKEQTEAFIKNRGLKAKEATIDYAILYENGEFSQIKADNLITSPEFIDLIKGYAPWFDTGFTFETTDKTYLRPFMEELNDCEKASTASTPFDWRDAVSVGYITYYPLGTRFFGMLCAKGVYYIQAGNAEYFVPEYVFADLISLSVFPEFNKPYTLSEGKNMTVDDLRTIFEGGLSSDEFSPFAHRTLLSATKNKQRLLFPVYEGEEQIGYAYISIDKEGNVNHLTLFDTDYRYIAFPEVDGLPEGEWVYKGHIQFKAD